MACSCACLSRQAGSLPPRGRCQPTKRRYLRAGLPPTASLASTTAAATSAAAAAVASAAPQPAAASTLGPPPLAAVVPEFPRIGGQVVRDWIGAAVDTLPGFNGDDLTRLIFPDLVGLVDAPTLLIGSILAVAVVYWEGGILLRQLRERQRAQRAQREQQRRHGQRGGGGGSSALGSWDADAAAGSADEGSGGWEAGGGLADGEGGLGAAGQQGEQGQQAAQASTRQQARMERARHERRRGLGWLALVTAGCIWMTGVVSGPTPFQP